MGDGAAFVFLVWHPFVKIEGAPARSELRGRDQPNCTGPMPNFKPLPAVERVKELLHYDPDTGIWTYAKARRRIRVGNIAGCPVSEGYRSIQIDGKGYVTHRLAWLYMTGEDPGEMEVDHIDRDRGNNRFSNLRLLTRSPQQFNMGIARNNKFGAKGLSWCNTHEYWVGSIWAFNKRHQKRSKNRAVVEEWLLSKRKELHGEHACHG